MRTIILVLVFLFPLYGFSQSGKTHAQAANSDGSVHSDNASDHGFMNLPLVTATGETQRIVDYVEKDRWTLVMIWSVNCHVCKIETPAISDFHDANKDSVATVIGLALDGVDAGSAVETFSDRYGMRFPTLLGDLIPVASAYQAVTQESLRGTPTFMLFDPQGLLQGVNPGPLRPEAVLEFIKRKS